MLLFRIQKVILLSLILGSCVGNFNSNNEVTEEELLAKQDNLKWIVLADTIEPEDPDESAEVWLNLPAFKQLSDAERAVVAYVSSQTQPVSL